jgi:hypothetical protein
MTDESTTPDSDELSQRTVGALDYRDVDAVLAVGAPDGVLAGERG